MLEITVLYRERPEVTLVPFGILLESPDISVGTIGNLLELGGGCVVATTTIAAEVSS
jgi:hypothetical protein